MKSKFNWLDVFMCVLCLESLFEKQNLTVWKFDIDNLCDFSNGDILHLFVYSSPTPHPPPPIPALSPFLPFFVLFSNQCVKSKNIDTPRRDQLKSLEYVQLKGNSGKEASFMGRKKEVSQ